MGAVAIALPPLPGQGGPKVCRNGHELTPATSRRTARGLKCLTCLHKREPRRILVCVSCTKQFTREGVIGGRMLLCDDCKPEATTARPTRTRVCGECDRRKDLEDFLLDETAGLSERQQYSDVCEECRTHDSPFEKAKRQVEELFGIPSSEWMNRGRHPLNVLHHARMISIHNSRQGVTPLPVSPLWDTMTAWRLIKRAGLTRKQRGQKA